MKKFSVFNKKTCLLILLVVSLATTFFVDDYFSVETLYKKGSVLIGWAESSGYFSVFFILVVYILSVALSMPVATILTTFMGFLFGYV